MRGRKNRTELYFRVHCVEVSNCQDFEGGGYEKNTPVALVEEAIKERDKAKRDEEALATDEYWVVYDRESVNKYADALHQQAFDLAKSNTLHVVLSNVCFEYWILLHFIDSAISANCCDDVIKDNRFVSALRGADILSYSKTDAGLARKIVSHVATARDRAKRINEQTKKSAPAADIDKPYRLNPYTNMYELLDAIDTYMATYFP